ncbi:ribose-phosphate diphosphokinase [Alkalibacterium iburiense]|uniref:Ribose-phosphate pyrophosphokinase n=1 Tax=Alkalibacterium iburiense TaxID=290589 RepID=A0ABP3HEM5_9LACT
MTKKKKQLRLFSLNSNRPLAEEVAKELGMELGKADITTFEDGEIRINIEESIRGDDVYFIQSTNHPSNDYLMEAVIMIDALRRASARKINVVIPYYGYARKDSKERPREAITAKVVANMLTVAGADRVVTMEMHSPQIQGFFDIPTDHLSAAALLANYFIDRELFGEEVVIVSPDHAGVSRAREMAELLNAPLAIIDKREEEEQDIPHKYNIVGDVEGKICILYDDLIDTGKTVTIACDTLLEAGAVEVYACATHAVFSHNAIEVLDQSALKKVVVTNTIDLSQKSLCPLVEQISVAIIIADAIKRIYEHKSIKPLFDKRYVEKLEHHELI